MTERSTPDRAPTVVWFRRDLRLGDNPAWASAMDSGRTVVALYVLDPALLATAGDLRRDLLFAHLGALDDALTHHGGRLRVERGDPVVVVPRVAAEIGAASVRFNADTTPYASRRDAAVAEALTDAGITPGAHWGTLVHPPGAVLTRGGEVSRVFTPFHKEWQRVAWSEWATAVDRAAVDIADDPGAGVPSPEGRVVHEPGEGAALDRLAAFGERVDRYLEDRDRPGVEGTSELSADLRFGTLSPRRVVTEIGTGSAGRAGFVRQLAWRDWYAHLLAEIPTLPTEDMRPGSGVDRWRDDEGDFDAWSRGLTGFPLVDAGMRQLLETGWMHNRVRMVCASFLVKDLLIDWRRGERWFRRLLVDADVSQNVGNWQWAAGTGPDAAPYFRVFNPTLQSRKFDPAGDYLRRWLPELAGLDDRAIHEPSQLGPIELAAAGVTLGEDYPEPIVDHHWARDRALAANKAAKGRA